VGVLVGLVGEVRATTYVVDSAAPGAADTNPGTEAEPFKTVQRATDAAKPGDIVYVMAGKYDERVTVKTDGTEGGPIAFVSRPLRSATVRGFDLRASYIRVEGFEITADKPDTAVQLRAGHCEILDNYIHDMMTAVSGTVGQLSPDGNTRDYSAVAHNRIAYNQVYHCEYGFILGGDDWLVENNEVSRLFMYPGGNRFADCDYSRFFGKGCIQRYNYYHGSTQEEIKTAHVDCLQTFTVNGEIAMNLLFEYNTCFDFHQMCMVESAPYIGSVRDWTFRHNVISANSPTMRGGWGPDIIQTLNVTIENCTISTVNWAAIGLRGQESTGGLIRNNILCEAERAVDDRMDFTREVLAPKNDGVTVRAMKGETVTISGADLIEGWKREGNGSWSAPLASVPTKVLRDGRPLGTFTCDPNTRRLVVKNGDPRLGVFETVVRGQGIDLAGHRDVRVEDITVVNTLGERISIP